MLRQLTGIHAWIQKAVRAIALLFILCASGFAQRDCTLSQPPGQAIPLWNWHTFNNGALPQTVFYQTLEDIVQFTIEGGARLNSKMTRCSSLFRHP